MKIVSTSPGLPYLKVFNICSKYLISLKLILKYATVVSYFHSQGEILVSHILELNDRARHYFNIVDSCLTHSGKKNNKTILGAYINVIASCYI